MRPGSHRPARHNDHIRMYPTGVCRDLLRSGSAPARQRATIAGSSPRVYAADRPNYVPDPAAREVAAAAAPDRACAAYRYRGRHSPSGASEQSKKLPAERRDANLAMSHSRRRMGTSIERAAGS